MDAKTIVVCGAGTMGSGIAQAALTASFRVVLYDVNPQMIEKGKASVLKGIEFLVSKNKLSPEQAAQLNTNILFTSQCSDCVGEVIIEAIIENAAAKQELFNKLAAINSRHAIFATNTSSLSVTELAAGVYNPSRVVGMHFFNPAPVMKLVEVVQSKLSDESAIQTIMEIAKKMGKTPVRCADVPGFIVNRVARHYYLEAMKLIENGLATIESVDEALENAGFKMGPFRLMDMIGMDINFSVSNIVWEALGKPARLTPSPLQKKLVEAGELGRKTGKGFYQY